MDGINIFVRCEPVSSYEVIDEMKVTGAFTSTKTHGKIIGAGGYNRIKYAIDEFKEEVKKAAKKGKDLSFNGVMVNKPKVMTMIRLPEGTLGTGVEIQGAEGHVRREQKTDKWVFYASKPIGPYDVVSSIKYDQGFNETMRGGNEMDLAINGMLDQAQRWVRKGKISDYEAIIVDWRALRSGYVRGELITFSK